MRLKEIRDECFQDYKKSSMYLFTCYCDWKCCIEGGFDIKVCQNFSNVDTPDKVISDEDLLNRYLDNNLTEAIVVGGLEPFLQFGELFDLIKYFRYHGCLDDFVIYTGYAEDEIVKEIERLKQFENIVIKFGRYIPDLPEIKDKVLGVTLASSNQYSKRIS